MTDDTMPKRDFRVAYDPEGVKAKPLNVKYSGASFSDQRTGMVIRPAPEGSISSDLGRESDAGRLLKNALFRLIRMTDKKNESYGGVLVDADKDLYAYLDFTIRTREDPAPEGVKVKPLEWTNDDDPDTITAFDYAICHEGHGYQVYRGAVVLGREHPTQAAAKAAAQADYERRILSALTAAPEGVSVAGAARVLLDHWFFRYGSDHTARSAFVSRLETWWRRGTRTEDAIKYELSALATDKEDQTDDRA